jgi:predicted aldo/keto reductase-like oxidoreductase
MTVEPNMWAFPLTTMYNVLMAPEQRASKCEECGECEEKCPQQIEIIETLKEVHDQPYQEDMSGH